jgi:hypothetical protein
MENDSGYKQYLTRIWLCAAILAQITFVAFAQDNGIAVSEPKPSDNRELLIKLDKLKKRLEQIQVVDAQKLSEALGLIQGSQSRDVSRSLSISTLPIPGLKTTRTPNANGDFPYSVGLDPIP